MLLNKQEGEKEVCDPYQQLDCSRPTLLLDLSGVLMAVGE